MPDPSPAAPEPVPLTTTPPPGDPPGWGAAAGSYFRARKELLILEAREAGVRMALKGALGGAAAVFGLFTYILALAGMIGWLASLDGFPAWYFITLILAALHGLAALIAVLLLRRPSPPAFPLTLQELQKDTSWLNLLKKRGKKH